MNKIAFVISLVGFWVNSFGQDQIKIKFDFRDTTNTIDVSVLKFYVTDMKLLFLDGLDQDTKEKTYLIDFEDSSSLTILINEPNGNKIHGIDLCIGTDSLKNVSGAFDGALDPIHGMYWAWNSGYINVKLEGSLNIEKRSADFEYHLGGYTHPYQTLRRKFLYCNKPESRELTIVVDLNNFMDYIEIERLNRVMSPGDKAAQLSTLFIESIDFGE